MQSIRVGGQTEQKHSRRGSSEENVKIKIRTSSVAAFLLALHCSSVGLAGTHFESSQDFRATIGPGYPSKSSVVVDCPSCRRSEISTPVRSLLLVVACKVHHRVYSTRKDSS